MIRKSASTKAISSAPGRRAAACIAALRNINLRPKAAQVAVSMPALGIATTLDAVFVDPRGNDVVVELKSTTVSASEFTDAYDTPCRKRPTLVGGKANTERNAHMIQCGFGVIAHPNATRGVVVVSCTDGAIVFDAVPDWCKDVSLFAHRPRTRPPQLHQRPYVWARVPKWPDRAEAAVVAYGGKVVGTELNGRVALLENGGAAVAATTPAKCASKRFRDACRAAFKACEKSSKLFVACPKNGRFIAYKFVY